MPLLTCSVTSGLFFFALSAPHCGSRPAPTVWGSWMLNEWRGQRHLAHSRCLTNILDLYSHGPDPLSGSSMTLNRAELRWVYWCSPCLSTRRTSWDALWMLLSCYKKIIELRGSGNTVRTWIIELGALRLSTLPLLVQRNDKAPSCLTCLKSGSCIPTSSWYIVTPQATIIHFYKHGSFTQGTFVPLGFWRPEESDRRVSGACLILETPGENVCVASFSAGACPQSLAYGYIYPLCLSRQIASFSFVSSPCVSSWNLYLLHLRKCGNTLGNSENPK